MKNTKLNLIAFASVLSLSLGIQTLGAQDYGVMVKTTRITTNGTGGLVYHAYRNRDIIRECARENGITNLTGLTLVYNRTADALQVVTGTNHTVVCTPLSFSGGTWLSNSNGTRAERLTFVFVETNTVSSGTLAATERFMFGPSNTVARFSLSGRLQYTVEAAGTNGPAIYRGTIKAGRGFGDLEDEDNDGD